MNDVIEYATEAIANHRRMRRRLVATLALFLVADLLLFLYKSPLTGWAMGATLLAVGANIVLFLRSLGRNAKCPTCEAERNMTPVCRKGVLWLKCDVCGGVFDTDCEFLYAGAAPARRTDVEDQTKDFGS